MTQSNLWLIFCVFFYLFSFGQSDDKAMDKIYNPTQMLIPKSTFQLKSINYPDSFSFCSSNGDGYAQINLDEIIDQLYQLSHGGDSEEALLISTSNGNVLKLTAPLESSQIEVQCSMNTGITDIAVNAEGYRYICNSNIISNIGPSGCVASPSVGFPWGTTMINSLSFDPLGNLIYGDYNDSKVYRRTGMTSEVWKDFGEGASGGDFVVRKGKLYVAWRIEGKYKLYEVTVDNGFNYVSHEDLGELPNYTYGLASEMGKLYGVTPDRLFSIDVDNMTFQTVKENDGAFGNWWGTAGLHEAIVMEVTAHLSHSDATNNSNAISGMWTNTVSGGQTLYFRIENTVTSQYQIVPVSIIINNPPRIKHPEDVFKCVDSGFGQFNLTAVENEILISASGGVTYSYHQNEFDANNGNNALSENYQALTANQIIYVRVKNDNNSCFSVEKFRIKTFINPKLKPLVNSFGDRILDNCYIDDENKGYFLLNEMAQNLLESGYVDQFNIEYYKTLSHAQTGIMKLPHKYYLLPESTQEIIVKVTNDNGCSSITNFFIGGDCYLTTMNLTGVKFPGFFTPNNDGINDFWNIRGLSKRMKNESVVQIFDRYGKTLFTYKPATILGWDGNYNGISLPSDDYWYKLITPSGRVFRGHFTLKR